MLSVTVVLAAFIALGSCNAILGGDEHPEMLIDASLHSEWHIYKARHQKQYVDSDEELKRRVAWEANLKIIDQHNREFAEGKHTYKLGANRFADLTNEEYRNTILMQPTDSTTIKRTGEHNFGHPGENPSFKAPAAVDWRTEGYVTDVKDQAQCGSCWSFSATGSMEGQHFKATGQLVSLSEQNLVDCSRPQGNMGCNGGLMDSAFTYVIKNQGIDTEDSYKYEARDGRCRFNKTNIGATISAFKDIPEGDEKALTDAIATIGPISVAIDAGHSSFQLYDGGVYNEARCSSTQLDHGVLAVGYDSQDGTDYYIVKNSWGEGWGLQGYIWMSRNKKNQCGIATMASYPIV